MLGAKLLLYRSAVVGQLKRVVGENICHGLKPPQK